jgi:hypothetical protein
MNFLYLKTFALIWWRGIFFPEEKMNYLDKNLISQDDADWMAQKKSEVLSVLIERVLPDDIGFEDYHHFDYLLPKTLEFPDEAYEFIEDKHLLKLHISFYQEKRPSYQVILCLVIKSSEKVENFIPILNYQTFFKEMTGIFLPQDAKCIERLIN